MNAIIIGAGPAGLTAAYELLTRTGIKPIIIEAESEVGGISKTIDYGGNRFDIGTHRFFTKSRRVLDLWKEILPFKNPGKQDKVMLVRERYSRILYGKKFYDYPVSLKMKTIRNLGLVKSMKIIESYIKAKIFPVKENSLEGFYINRFGRELYETFFRGYTKKVWGIDCKDIPTDWGIQRVKGLSIGKVISNALKIKGTVESSLIEQFYYPKLGAGQMYEELANRIKKLGGKILLNSNVVGIKVRKNRLESVKVKGLGGKISEIKGDYFFSSMAVNDLIKSMKNAPEEIKKLSSQLNYRDFIMVVFITKSNFKNKDNWIYIQENSFKMGRVDFFTNSSPYLSKKNNGILGVEYFCNYGDEFWNKSDKEIEHFAVNEILKTGFVNRGDILDWKVIRMRKAYPSYSGSYLRFGEIRNFLDGFENLFLIGRNGMHRYNNMDHSILSGMVAVDNLISNRKDRRNIWGVNTEKEYHEEIIKKI